MSDTSTANLRARLVCQWDSRDYVPGSMTWTDRVSKKNLNFQTTAPTKVSSDGVEIENDERYVSDLLSDLGTQNDVTLEWYGRIDGVFDSDKPATIVYISNKHNWWGGIGAFAKADPSGIMFDISRNDHARVVSGDSTAGFHHIIATLSRSEGRVYLDSSSMLGSASNYNGQLEITKNYIYTDEGAGTFKGAIQKINLWTRLLTSDEIASRMADVEFKNAFFFKTGGKWTTASGIYRKKNGVWELSNENEMLKSRKVWGKAFLPKYEKK